MAELMYDLTTLRTMLSTSTAFQTWSGSANATAALAHILYFKGKESDMPCAVLAPASGWTRECDTWDQTLTTTPQVTITFVHAVTASSTDSAVFQALTTSIDAIMEEIESNTTWRIRVWTPAGEDAPERASHSSHVDIASFTVIVTGDMRS